jgi:hypothetical protein
VRLDAQRALKKKLAEAECLRSFGMDLGSGPPSAVSNELRFEIETARERMLKRYRDLWRKEAQRTDDDALSASSGDPYRLRFK